MTTERLRNALIEIKESLPALLEMDLSKQTVTFNVALSQVKGPYFFSMSQWRSKVRERTSDTECGTVCCIGGLCEIILQDRLTIEELTDADALFFPIGYVSPTGDPMSEITQSQAAKAIENFLDTGDPKWEGIL